MKLVTCEKLERYCAEREKDCKIKYEKIGERRAEKRGEAKTRIENAKKMIADKLPLDEVAYYSGLSLSKVKELAG